MSLQSSLEYLKTLSKNKALKKKSPRLYTLVKETMRSIERVMRLQVMTEREKTRVTKLIADIEEGYTKEVQKWLTRN